MTPTNRRPDSPGEDGKASGTSLAGSGSAGRSYCVFQRAFITHCVRLCTDGSLHGAIDMTGGSALLRKMATIEGLGELAELCETVTEMAVPVRVRSPSPQLQFLDSAAKSRYAKRTKRFHLTKSAPHCH